MAEMTDIKGIGPSKADTLEEEGYESLEDVAQADPDDLSEISGISQERALEYMVSAGDLLDEESRDDSEQREEASDEFDLTPSEVSEELEEEEDVDEEESAADVGSDGGDESDDEPESYTVSIDFETRMQYHTFHAAVMRYHEAIYTSNQPKSDAMQKVLDGLETDGAEYELTETEFNTLHTSVKQARTDYQGDNLIDHMDALKVVEGKINDQRRDLLF